MKQEISKYFALQTRPNPIT